MQSRFPRRRSRALFVLLAVVVTAAAIRFGVPLRAHPEGVGAIESYLHGLVDTGAISEAQHEQIERLFERGLLEQLGSWLTAQEEGHRISADTHEYVNALLELTPAEASMAAAPANYGGNGNVTLLGRLDAQPPAVYFGDNSSTGTLYNGIWGYAAGSREYALQANSFGLHIIDVTDPTAPFRVQFIDMSGGLNPPKGQIWRDVDIHNSPTTGKTYAYVGAQSNGELWIIDLSYLSTTTANGVNSNPIPPAGIANRGRTNYGHTVFVNDALGLLMTNSANNASTLGCQIFDLLQDPFNPPIIGGWSGSGRDCHDSYVRANVPGTGGKNLLYAADGYSTRYRVVDITNVRTGGGTTLLGTSAGVSGIYAHSNWLDDEAKYLYAFEEFNVRDIGVYDVSNPANPIQVTTFQYSGDATASSRVHNGQVRGKYLLTAYYEAGLRVFDISNPVNPVEVGKYETWRDPDGDGIYNKPITGVYNGAWNLHVYLPSGNVLLSDMKSGTFVFRVDPVAAPSTPGGLNASGGNGQVGLTWTAASGATGYSVRRGTTAGGPYAVVASNVVATAFVDTSVTNGTQYFYRVTGTNAEGEGGSSSEATATPAAASTPTSTSLSSSPNPSTSGQPATFTATVTSGGGTPAGTVTFTEGATVLASGVAVNGSGQAAFTTTTLSTGSHIITASFTGASGWGNSSGSNAGSPHVVTAAGTTTLTLTSVDAQDGWVLESNENANAGGSLNVNAGTTSALRIGDDNKDKQYKTIVAFDTSGIPDNATIVSVTLRLRRGTDSGSNPFTTHGACLVDVKNGAFNAAALETGDFQAAATALQAASLSNAATNGSWSEGALNAAGLAAINKLGTTQLRVYFALDDNDNGRNDYIGYHSGGSSTPANRPQLIVTYQ
jgi:choice-of-anchor B domain-containing protein